MNQIMLIADHGSSRPEEAGPIILDLPERVTEETLIALARKNPEYRFETTADARLVVSPLAGFFASGGEVELARQIANWNVEHQLGHVTGSSGGITLANGSIKGPDATFTSHARITALSPKRKQRAFEQIAPDAVFELLSPTDRLAYTVAKCREYVETGSGVAVLLNPRDRSVTLYRKGHDPMVTSNPSVAIGDEMPGVFLDAESVYAASEVIR